MRKGPANRRQEATLCTRADEKTVNTFCQDCQKLICKFCENIKHGHHSTLTVQQAAKTVKYNLMEHDETDIMHSMKSANVMVRLMKEELITAETDELKKIDERLNKLHKELHKFRLNLVDKIRDTVKKDKECLNKAEREINRSTASLQRLSDEAEQLLTEAGDIDVIKRGPSLTEELRLILEEEIPMPVKGSGFFFKFTPGNADDHTFKRIVGDISVQSEDDEYETESTPDSHATISVQSQVDENETESTPDGHTTSDDDQDIEKATENNQPTMAANNLKHVSTVRVAGYDVPGLCATTDDMCWCAVNCGIKLVDIHGRETRTVMVKGGVPSITTAEENTVYMTCLRSKSIKRITADDTVSTVQTLDFYPCGLTYDSETGELLVCGGEKGVYSVTRERVHKTFKDIDFQWAHDVAINKHGDICVIDSGLKTAFIVRPDRRHFINYNEREASTKHKIIPLCVTSDPKGNFIVVDEENHALHFITRDGENISICDTIKHFKQLPLSVSSSPSGLLWVGFKGGNVGVYDSI